MCKRKYMGVFTIVILFILMAPNTTAKLYKDFPVADSDVIVYSDYDAEIVSYYPIPPPVTYDCDDGDDVLIQYNCSYDDQRSPTLTAVTFYFNLTAIYSGTNYYDDWGPFSTYGGISGYYVLNVTVLNVDVYPTPAIINITYNATVDGLYFYEIHEASFDYIFD